MQVTIYTSPTCAPCKTLKPILMGLAVVYQFNCVAIQAGPNTQAEFVERGVRTVPTVIVFDGDREVARFSGNQSSDFIEHFLRDNGVIGD